VGPSDTVVLFTIRHTKWRNVLDYPSYWAARKGVVEHSTFDDSAVGHLRFGVLRLHILPPQAPSFIAAVRELQGASCVTSARFARQPDTYEPLARCENDATVRVVPSVTLVLAHYRELHAIDGLELF